MYRRQFIKSLMLTGSALSMPRYAQSDMLSSALDNTLRLTEPLALPAKTQSWLGPELWANRLQDWRVSDNRIECLEGGASFEVRTVSLLTRFLLPTKSGGRIRCRLGLLTPGKNGFAGFLLGVGAGQLDYRGAALAQRAPGVNGGLMAVVDQSGKLGFVDFSTELSRLDFAKLRNNQETSNVAKPNPTDWELDCQFEPTVDERCNIVLTLYEVVTRRRISTISLHGLEPAMLSGGISLVSSPNVGVEGAKWWFSDIQTGGPQIQIFAERALGPVLGCLHSLNTNNPNNATLKLTAQLFPLAWDESERLLLQTFDEQKDQWVTRVTSNIKDGYVGLFRVTGWDARRAWRYRLRHQQQKTVWFNGTIGAGIETNKPLSISLFSCILPTAKGLDELVYNKLIPQEKSIGRYTTDNILFPHKQLVEYCEKQTPDIYLFCGDQYYETYPTRYGRHTAQAKLDTLYRWYLWTFRDVLRNKPCLVLADDHDVLQGNLWGQAGLDSDDDKEESGGYKWDKSLVKMVYRIQHSHNPDSYDDTAIAHGIPVNYGSFIYRGTDFAFVEDRKFKSPPNPKADPKTATGELLGARQEIFLSHWSKNKTMPKICVTASMWGSPQTGADGTALLDYDANGYPPDGRKRAVELVAKANALVLAGDQHLAMVAHQGLEEFDDGALFFAGPAAAAFWQRWFEGNGKLHHQRSKDPNTGEFIDTFGNKMRVLAVANPKISHTEFDRSTKSWGKFVADAQLKSEGYGIIRVDTRHNEFVLECWPADVDPQFGDQYAGWPVRHPISATPTKTIKHKE